MPDSKEFLKALYRTEGHVYGHLIRDDLKFEHFPDFIWPYHADALCDMASDPNAYLGFGLYSDAGGTRSAVQTVGAFWTTVNIEVSPFDRTVEALKKFPVRPSAGYIVRNILHVFWFLQPLSRDDFDAVWAANHDIISKLKIGTQLDDTHKDPVLCKANLQAKHFDFDGCFRSPGQPGTKFVCWHPEVRYTLDQFADLLNPPRPQEAAPPATTSAQGPPKSFDLDIPDEDRDAIIKAMGENWYEAGHMSMNLAGMLAHASIAKETTRLIVVGACRKGGGDYDRASKTVDETYERMAKGENVCGTPALIKAFDPLPETTKEKFKKALEKIKKLIPKPTDGNAENPGPEPDFEIRPPLIKFDSRPARWSVTLECADGQHHEATCETTNFIQFNLFQAAFYEQTHTMLKDITQYRWKRMIADAAIEVKPTPPEARPDGAIETALEEFLAEARETPDVGVLRTFAGYDETTKFFRFNAFQEFMKELGHRLEHRTVFDNLKRLGFNPTVKRLGTKTYRLWMKEMKADNNGHQSPQAKQPEKPPENTPELFQGEAS